MARTGLMFSRTGGYQQRIAWLRSTKRPQQDPPRNIRIGTFGAIVLLEIFPLMALEMGIPNLSICGTLEFGNMWEGYGGISFFGGYGSPSVEGILSQFKQFRKSEWHQVMWQDIMKWVPSGNIALENHGINITILNLGKSSVQMCRFHPFSIAM